MYANSVLMVTYASFLCAASGTLRAQELIRVLDKDYWHAYATIVLPRLELLDDHDVDGLGEFLVGGSGKVSVVSSVSGLELSAHSAPLFDAEALGDVNGDGFADFGAASILYPGGGMWIWSGRDYSLLYQDPTPTIAITVAPIGDVNGDGLADIAYSTGPIRVIAGGSFEELYVALPDAPAALFGARIVGMGDVDGDRVPDFAASAPWDPIFGLYCFQAWIFVFSGVDGRQLYRIQGSPPCDGLGYGMASPGDVNGDGVADLAATSYTASACIRFFDGRNGELLDEVCDEHGLEGFGRVLKAVGDVNGNGYGDVLAYGNNELELPAPFNRSGQGEAWLVDGGTREFLYRFTNPRSLSVNRYGGYALAFTACGDWNHDGQPDIAIGAVPNFVQVGLIDIFSGHPLGVRTVEESCVRRKDGPRIGSSGIPVLGRDYPIHLSNVPPGTRALLVTGHSLLGSSRHGFGPESCGLVVRPDRVTKAVVTKAGGDSGAATVHMKIANKAALVGTKLYAQWIVPRGRGATGTTRALEITIQASLPLPYVP